MMVFQGLKLAGAGVAFGLAGAFAVTRLGAALLYGEIHRFLADPDHPVSSTFLWALTVLMRNPDQSAERVREEDAKNRLIVSRELLEAVTQKRGKALALSLNAVLESGNYVEGKAQPLSKQMADQVAAVFEQLPIEKQVQILESRWDFIKSQTSCRFCEDTPSNTKTIRSQMK